MLILQCICIVCKDLGGEIKDGKRARHSSRGTGRDDSQIPAHNQRDEPKATSYFEVVVCVLNASGRWVVAQLVVRRGEEAKEEDEREEDKDEGYVGAEAGAEEAECDECHGDVVVSLSGVELLAQCTWNVSDGIARHESNGWALDVSDVDPVTAIDDEDRHGKRVAKNELENTRQVHGDASQEQIRAAGGGDGVGT